MDKTWSHPSVGPGHDGYLHHTRTGLVGAVAYWAAGSMALAVVMIVALIVHLKIVDRVRAALPQSKADREAETNARREMVDFISRQ